MNNDALELTRRLGPSGYVVIDENVILQIPGKSGVDAVNSYVTVVRKDEKRSYSVLISPTAREHQDRFQILDFHGEPRVHEWRKFELGTTKGDLYRNVDDVAQFDKHLKRALVLTSDQNK